jgi:arginyl-tRNA synthetase
VQFTHARLCSIERKFAAKFPNPLPCNPALLTREDEKNVLMQLTRCQTLFERAV